MKWSGWALGDTALYLLPESGEEKIGLYLQMRDQTALVAIFTNAEMAQFTQEWLESAITNVGLANSDLTAQLAGYHDGG